MENNMDKKYSLVSGGQIGGHDYVDLGLPSRIMWATCNIGALKPYELGDYFAWGEVTPKEDYSEALYKWGTMFNLTKYCTKGKYGMVDNKTDLDLEDDAARYNWEGVSKLICPLFLFIINEKKSKKPRLSQAGALLFHKNFVSL